MPLTDRRGGVRKLKNNRLPGGGGIHTTARPSSLVKVSLMRSGYLEMWVAVDSAHLRSLVAVVFRSSLNKADFSDGCLDADDAGVAGCE